MNNFKFFRTAVRDYRVGALTTSSKYVIRKIIKELADRKFIIEYGAGDGVITKELLKHLPLDGRVVAIELNKDLFNELKKIKDKRLTIINGDIIEISKDLAQFNLPQVDAVISGIPFTFLPSEMRRTVVQNTYDGLSNRGLFIVYQYSLLMKKWLSGVFDKFKSYFEPRNFPPYFIMVGEKKMN
ncbi:MAG TPA: rRNA adenine N-6-methyltransferase family protein [Candidatus Paceibacterota bacterium]